MREQRVGRARVVFTNCKFARRAKYVLDMREINFFFFFLFIIFFIFFFPSRSARFI